MVTQDSATTVSANIDAGMPWRRTFGDNVVYTDWRRDNSGTPCSRCSSARARAGGRLGIEYDHISPDMRAQIPTALPGMEPSSTSPRPPCGSA